jgi:hypothetical protein
VPERTATWIRPLRHWRSPLWLLASAGLCAWAQDNLQSDTLPSARERLEVSSNRSPPPYSTALRVDVTRWMDAGPSSRVGLSLGMATQTSASVPAGAMTDLIWEPTLGVHWRTQLGGGMHLDFSTWARTPYRSQMPAAMDMIWYNRQPNYGTSVEVQWGSARLGSVMPEFGAIGVRLEGDSQLLLRTRAGGPMLYYRTRF